MIRHAASHRCSRSTSAPMVSLRCPGSRARPSCAAWGWPCTRGRAPRCRSPPPRSSCALPTRPGPPWSP
eukprot:14075402-Alexandrium_andersonii.AAC.1